MSVDPERRRWLASVCGSGACWLAAPLQAATGTTGARASVEVGESVLRALVSPHFLSFNLNLPTLDADYGSDAAGVLRPDLMEAMRAFPGAYYRYPGGNVSNHFAIDAAIGPPAARSPQRLTESGKPSRVRFGPESYFDFIGAVGGQSWYTLNLVGWDADAYGVELPSAVVAAANGRLAALRVRLEAKVQGPRMYHLGNELDRNRYRWPPGKYVARCRDTMAAVRTADPQARFVAFLRDFDITGGTVGAVARGTEHAHEVLAALPELRDVSLQIYYDRAAGEGQRADLGWRWPLIDRFVDKLPQREGQKPAVWITEHAVARDLGARERMRRERLATTSGIDGAVAACDFVIGALTRPALAATFWHSLGGGVWWDLFEPGSHPLRPTPAYHAFLLLRQSLAGAVHDCRVHSSNVGGYPGGYDVNAAALRSGDTWSLILINRAAVEGELRISLPAAFRAGCAPAMQFVAADEWPAGSNPLASRSGHVNLAPSVSAGSFHAALPPRSVAVIRLDQTGVAGC